MGLDTFGQRERESIFAHVEQALGSPVASVLFTAQHLSYVSGVTLADGREVVVKVRAPNQRLSACCEVQRQLWASGFPAPEPLVPPTVIGPWALSIETYVGGGEVRSAQSVSAEDFAVPLARLIAQAPAPHAVGPLGALPWISSWSGGKHLWPKPDDVDADLNAVEGPRWIEEAAIVARERVRRCTNHGVVGHGDWLSQNLHWVGNTLHVVHDWDSVVVEPEVVVVGVSAAFYPGDGTPDATATIEQTEDFINAYAAARGRPWSSDELQVLWASGLWNRAFDAKKQVVEGRIRTLTEDDARERMRRAGA